MGRLAHVAALSLALAPAAAPQPPVYRAEVRLVRMLTTVRDAAGQLVGGLQKDDFRVLDNGVEQELAVFERHTEQPLSVAVLIDTSGTTLKEINYELDAVKRFSRLLFGEGNPEDTAALYSFNDEVTLQAPFTRRVNQFDRALRAIKAQGPTALYDAIYLAAYDQERREGRHVVVAVTDGGDTASRVDFQGALKALHRANTVFYAVVVVPVANDAGRNLRGENALITLSQWTGGRVFFPTLGKAMDTAFGDILSDLRTQYLLGYYPRGVVADKNGFHNVKVEVRRPRHSVSARNGYFELP